MKKILAIFLTASLLAGMTAIPALAATKQKITSVSLTITSDIQVGDEIENDGLDVESSSAKYTVGDYEFTNSGFEWFEDDIPQAKIYLHSCGAIADIIEDLIDCGVDILNPVQTSAAGMDPVTLKDPYYYCKTAVTGGECRGSQVGGMVRNHSGILGRGYGGRKL